jgi:hypothetical protein
VGPGFLPNQHLAHLVLCLDVGMDTFLHYTSLHDGHMAHLLPCGDDMASVPPCTFLLDLIDDPALRPQPWPGGVFQGVGVCAVCCRWGRCQGCGLFLCMLWLCWT